MLVCCCCCCPLNHQVVVLIEPFIGDEHATGTLACSIPFCNTELGYLHLDLAMAICIWIYWGSHLRHLRWHDLNQVWIWPSNMQFTEETEDSV
ncbi:hypothetical protein SORBI_3004G071100 [Sorghum bicolor]|uniref:Uncharacterized protein n=1 Tax=Sorghum bicolor TaxID=4558 RepID=A0A194YN88_SORBI|nr:hypothetical protein SORBI_3004G071100 [Sorghum bicolor]KXG29651.1 hypothetical protein SORBI_3004G071100 [Sorghum bicolor]